MPVSIYSPGFVPMTQRERVHDYFKTTFSATSVVASAASAGLSQLNNRPEEWGQGSTGYSRRYLNAYARGVMRHTMMLGISSALHEDNRYRRSTDTRLGPRLKYSLMSTLLARRDDGSRRVSISRLGGTAGTAFVSRIWQPADTNGVGDAWSGFAFSMGSQAAFNVVHEFFPRRKVK